MLRQLFYSYLVGTALLAKASNVVFILTDDQDAQLNSLKYMPKVQELLLAKGTHYRKHYCTVAWCCPSRVNILTGKSAHNTNVTNVVAPYGGYDVFVNNSLNENWVPLWLQEAGINNYYVGKLMNSHTIKNFDKPEPSGFTDFDFLLEPNTYSYLNPIFQRKGHLPFPHRNEYNTDLLSEKGLRFIDDAVKEDKPFFLTLAPIAPHSDVRIELTPNGTELANVIRSAPSPAARHEGMFQDEIVPRGDSFNPSSPSGVDWVYELPQLSAENVTYNDYYFRQRLGSLQAIDDMVEAVVNKLAEHNVLEDTYIFYSADNGYHIGQHRLEPGKCGGWEEDINVPLIVRGPNVPEGEVVDLVTSHTDLAPTFFKALGVPLRDDFDGMPVPVTAEQIDEYRSGGKQKEITQVEMWSDAVDSDYNEPVDVTSTINTYKSVRILGTDYGFYYSVWCTGSHELYDMTADPLQMTNLYNPSTTYPGDTPPPVIPSNSSTIALGNTSYPTLSLVHRLDALLFVLKTCKGKTCYLPWETLMPNTGVNSLRDAMDTKYDDYFAGLPRVEWDVCDIGQVLEVEGEIFGPDDAYGNGTVTYPGRKRGPTKMVKRDFGDKPLGGTSLWARVGD
ncbi:Arylsulphatase [Polyplosphaeria fusca]|uniref:Arylsulfatase n=1 Tax=Polyplosphaeria fusca TaxID=682080 RepID=A0A9P4QQS4_9PLEO|nr:Arylsulphatase [Polyplosphaeria fusca]